MVSKAIQNIYETNNLTALVRPTNYTFFFPTATSVTAGVIKVGSSVVIRNGILDIKADGVIDELTLGTDQIYTDLNGNLATKFVPFKLYESNRIFNQTNKNNLNEYFLRINMVCNTLISKYKQIVDISKQFTELNNKWTQLNEDAEETLETAKTAVNTANAASQTANQASTVATEAANTANSMANSKLDKAPLDGIELIGPNGKIVDKYISTDIFEQLEWIGDWDAETGTVVLNLRKPNNRAFRKGDLFYVTKAGIKLPNGKEATITNPDELPIKVNDRLVCTGNDDLDFDIWQSTPGPQGKQGIPGPTGTSITGVSISNAGAVVPVQDIPRGYSGAINAIGTVDSNTLFTPSWEADNIDPNNIIALLTSSEFTSATSGDIWKLTSLADSSDTLALSSKLGNISGNVVKHITISLSPPTGTLTDEQCAALKENIYQNYLLVWINNMQYKFEPSFYSNPAYSGDPDNAIYTGVFKDSNSSLYIRRIFIDFKTKIYNILDQSCLTKRLYIHNISVYYSSQGEEAGGVNILCIDNNSLSINKNNIYNRLSDGAIVTGMVASAGNISALSSVYQNGPTTLGFNGVTIRTNGVERITSITVFDFTSGSAVVSDSISTVHLR